MGMKITNNFVGMPAFDLYRKYLCIILVESSNIHPNTQL